MLLLGSLTFLSSDRVGKPLPMAFQVLGARQPGKREEIHAGRVDEPHVLRRKTWK